MIIDEDKDDRGDEEIDKENRNDSQWNALNPNSGSLGIVSSTKPETVS